MPDIKEVKMADMLVREAQLHGVKRLADKKYRLHWALALILLMWGATSVVLLHISRFLDHPTNIVRWEMYRNNMSFPTVLVYPELYYHDYKIDALLDKMEFPPDLNRTYIKSVIRQLATFYNPDVIYTVTDLENVERLLDLNNFNMREVTEMLTTSCEESLLRCRWKGVMVDCSLLFHMELSDFGYCCVFNGRSLKRELANGATYISEPKMKMFTTSVGPKSGLMLVLNQSLQLSDMDRTYKWIVISSPQRFVDSTYSNGTPISPGKEVWFGYDAVSFHVSEDARSLDPHLRRCTMSDTKLEIFPVYHKNYCILECAMREVLWHCKCVLFTQPSHPGVPYCRAKSLMCARLVSVSATAEKCGCYITCDVDTATIAIDDFMMLPNNTAIDYFYEGLDYEKVSVIKVFVDKREVYLNLRRSYFTPIDLFAQIGGIFNVYFGCSVLSLLELVQLGWHKVQQWRWNRRLKHIAAERKHRMKKKINNDNSKKVRFT